MTAEVRSIFGGRRLLLAWLMVAAGLVLQSCKKTDTTDADPALEPDPPAVNVADDPVTGDDPELVEETTEPVAEDPEPVAEDPEPIAEAPEPVAEAPEVSEPEPVESPAPEEPQEAVDPLSVFVYVDEITGEEIDLPNEFKEYPEWGLFQYADQVVRHNMEQMKQHAGNPAKVAELQAKVREFTKTKADSLAAMRARAAKGAE